MGTRCITEVRSKWDSNEWETHAVIYRHWDGYLSEHGTWLYNFLNGMKIVNGIGGDMPPKFANGPGRLAAMIVTQLQIDEYDPDLLPSVSDVGQEYHYRIDVECGAGGGDIIVTVFDGPMTAFGFGGENCNNQIFKGTVEEFGKFLEEKETE